MPAQKRKRASIATPETNKLRASRALNTPSSTESPLPTDPATDVPYTMTLVPDLNATPNNRKKGKKADNTALRLEPAIENTGDPIAYSISPGSNWEAMKKYKNFVVKDSTFGSHDYVYVNNKESEESEGLDGDDDKKEWIAYVLEVRAKDPTHVFLRIYWMYSPVELPQGAEKYHGKTEVIASNHMEVIDAMTVSDRADVTHWEEKDDDPAMTGIYWRQTYNCLKKKLGPLRKSCVCKGYHNPDKLLIHCSNPACHLWLHEDCVVNDGVTKAYAELLAADGAGETTKIEGNTNRDDGEASGTIQVARPGKRVTRGTPNGTSTPSALKSTDKTSAKKKGRSRRSGMSGPEAWEGDWEGKIESRTKLSAKGEEIQEITGQLIITDLRGDVPETIKKDLRCPNCDELLTSPSDGLTS